MSKDEQSDDNINLKQIKTNLILHRAQSDIRPIKRSYFYNDSQIDNENTTTIENDISIPKMMTSPLRQPPTGTPIKNGKNVISTPKETDFKSGTEQNKVAPSPQESNSADKTGTADDSNNEKSNCNVNAYEGRMYNRHTPDLNRIIKYRKSSNSPGKNLLERFKAEQESDSYESEEEKEERESNICTSVAGIDDKSYSDPTHNLKPDVKEESSHINPNESADITDADVTHISNNQINNATSSPNRVTDSINDIDVFKENLKKQLENPSDDPDTPRSQRSINIFQSPGNEGTSPVKDDENNEAPSERDCLLYKTNEVKLKQNEGEDYFYAKGDIIYSLESRHDESEKLSRKENCQSQTQNDSTIIFDSQSNKHNFSKELFETQGMGTVPVKFQNNDHMTSSNSSDEKYLEVSQTILSTLTFSADSKYNALVESQKSITSNNEDRKVVDKHPVIFEETQPILYNKGSNSVYMETQPISYKDALGNTNIETQPILHNKDQSITDRETQNILFSQPNLNNQVSKPSENGAEMGATILNEINDSATHIQVDNVNNSEVINQSDIIDPHIEDIQVPRTSSPEKRSSPSKQLQDPFPAEIASDTFINNRVTVTLDVPRIPDFTFDEDNNSAGELHGEIIESDMDETQDLPEMEDDSEYIATKSETQPTLTNFFETAFKSDTTTDHSDIEHINATADFISQNSEIDDSQKIVVSRRATKRKRETITLSDKEDSLSGHDEIPSDQSSPERKLTKNGSTAEIESRVVDKYPTDYRNSDPDELTKDNIHFNNAVWCVYDMDLRHYPGILLSVDEANDACVVLFNSERYTGRMEDISYLDIRIGDIVQVENNNLYKVIGLQCLRKDPEIIRCVRGYDTVALERTGHGNKDKHIVRALADIRITIEDWAERTKIKDTFFTQPEGSFEKSEEHLKRRQTRTQTISPRKSTRTKRTSYTNSDDEDDSFNSELQYTNNLLIELSKQIGKTSSNLFDKCIFILTGIAPLEKGLIECIRTGGGKVLKSDFKELFDFEQLEKSEESFKQFHLELTLKAHIKEYGYKFACILGEGYSRSVKYLQTLALGWPCLHWNFIEACVRNNNVSPNLIYEFLLPSGVSFRLGPMCDEGKGPVLSNDIFSFYSKFIENATLNEQLGLRGNILDGYTIIFCGSLNLDNLLRFYFAALGISKLIHIPKTSTLLATDGNILDFYMKQDDNTTNKLIIFINEQEKVIHKVIKNTKKSLNKRYKDTPIEYHVEDKEWLIQTLINRNHRFDQYFYKDT